MKILLVRPIRKFALFVQIGFHLYSWQICGYSLLLKELLYSWRLACIFKPRCEFLLLVKCQIVFLQKLIHNISRGKKIIQALITPNSNCFLNGEMISWSSDMISTYETYVSSGCEVYHNVLPNVIFPHNFFSLDYGK